MRQLKIATQITNRDSQVFGKYLQEISKMDMISENEETVLAKRIKMGDDRAFHQLVKANLRFVVSVAKQYQHQGLSLDDLVNEGNYGLTKAAQRFDETKGFKFISYAVWWIRQSILAALANESRVVRLPQNKIGVSRKIMNTCSIFEQEHEREPSMEELAEITEMEESEVTFLFQKNHRHLSLDVPLNANKGGFGGEIFDFGDLLKGELDSDKDLIKDSMRIELDLIMKKILNSKQIDVIYGYYQLNGDESLTTDKIMKKYNFKTRERVRQIREQAIRKIQCNKNAGKLLRKYLG